jgi:hypothetical protein
MPRFGTLLCLVLVALATTATRPALAAVKEFPYEAVIETDEAYVRCGPGKNFYTTMKLARGQHVTVRRHDPGGWFMIDPPPGSFSLIRIEDVVQEGTVATVKRLEQGQASVRIGSSLDPTADSIFQRKLSSGERAEILGEVMIPRKDRQVPMFRIRPPRGEFRWIEGNDVAPLDPEIKQQQARDPFSTPPRSQEARQDSPRRDSNGQPPTVTSASSKLATGRPVSQSGTATSTHKNGKTPTQQQQVVIGPATTDPRGRLEQIDVQFRDMIQRDPPSWNLSQIEQAYLDLRRNPAAAGVAGQVDLRFSALAHYKQVKAEYDDYYRLVSGTSRRDAELAAVENSLAPQNSRPAIQPGARGGGPADSSSGDANYQTPSQGRATPPTLSLPVNSPRLNVALQSTPSDQNSSQPQGPTLGAPVPAPVEYRDSAGPSPSQPPAGGTIDSPSEGSRGSASGARGNTPQGSIAPPSATDAVRPDTDLQPFPGEMAPTQAPTITPQRPRNHTSQFAPNPTGQSPNAFSPSATSPAVTPQLPSDPRITPGFGQPGPASSMGPPSPMQNQPFAPQRQTYAPQYSPGNNGAPFASQQPGMQPPGMPQPGVQQPMLQQPGLQQPMQQQPGAQQPMLQQQQLPQQPGMRQPGPQEFGSQTPGPQPSGSPPNSAPPGGTATPSLAPPRQVRPPGSPPLDGAGIVQQAAATFPNGPRHVLLAPNGRILAYLQAERGINLDAYIGRQMGIIGVRAYRSELQTDLIVVRGMIPVRLAP